MYRTFPHVSPDIVQITRCKDCKWWTPFSPEDNEGHCQDLGEATDYMFFCAGGERKKMRTISDAPPLLKWNKSIHFKGVYYCPACQNASNKLYNFCPTCGARMYGEVDDEAD